MDFTINSMDNQMPRINVKSRVSSFTKIDMIQPIDDEKRKRKNKGFKWKWLYGICELLCKVLEIKFCFKFMLWGRQIVVRRMCINKNENHLHHTITCYRNFNYNYFDKRKTFFSLPRSLSYPFRFIPTARSSFSSTSVCFFFRFFFSIFQQQQ